MHCACTGATTDRSALAAQHAEIRIVNRVIDGIEDAQAMPVIEHNARRYRVLTVFMRCLQHGGVRLYVWPAEQDRWQGQRLFIEPTAEEWSACLCNYAATPRPDARPANRITIGQHALT